MQEVTFRPACAVQRSMLRGLGIAYGRRLALAGFSTWNANRLECGTVIDRCMLDRYQWMEQGGCIGRSGRRNE